MSENLEMQETAIGNEVPNPQGAEEQANQTVDESNMQESITVDESNVQQDQSVDLNQDQSVNSNLEARARAMGWVPADEFRGDQSRHVSAEDFIAKGENELPVVKENVRRLTDKLVESEKTIENMKEHYTKMQDMVYKKALEEIKEKQRVAVEDGDMEVYEKLDAKRESIQSEWQKETTPEPKQQDTGMKPEDKAVVDYWMVDNPWYKNDPDLRVLAESYHERLGQTRPDMSLAENLQEVSRQLKLNFPQKFGIQQQQQPRKAAGFQRVEGAGAINSVRQQKKTYNDLTEEARSVCDNLVRSRVMTKEEYIDDLLKLGEANAFKN